MNEPNDSRLAFALVEADDGTGLELVTFVPDGNNPIAVDVCKPDLAELNDLSIACQAVSPRVRHSLASQLDLIRE